MTDRSAPLNFFPLPSSPGRAPRLCQSPPHAVSATGVEENAKGLWEAKSGGEEEPSSGQLGMGREQARRGYESGQQKLL